MAEYNEYRTGDSDIILKDNIVRSSILPETSADMDRVVRIREHVKLEGAVYGERIDVESGDVIFEGAVYANNELHIAGELNGTVVFQKAAASADTIAAFVNNGRVLFWSDINAPKVRLKNCYIGGSIFGQEIFLENCVVLGGVFGTKEVKVTNCLVGTFHSTAAEIAGVNYMLYPACFSTEPLGFLPGARIYNLSLAHLGALYKGEPEDADTGKILVDLENDHQRTVLVGDDEVTRIVNTYSVSGRILAADMIDMEKLENHFLIGAGALGTQVLKTYNLVKKDGTRSEDLTVENIAEFFFSILHGRIEIRELSGEVSLADIKRNFE